MPTNKQLARKVERLENLLCAFQSRLSMLSGWFGEAVSRDILGVRTVRGNDGVMLETIKSQGEKIGRGNKSRLRRHAHRVTGKARS